VCPDGWIPGTSSEAYTEAWLGQAKKYDDDLYACVVRAGMESVMQGGKIEIWPVLFNLN
jgi:hypothetical protein